MPPLIGFTLLVAATLGVAWRAPSAIGAVAAAAATVFLVFAEWALRDNPDLLVLPGGALPGMGPNPLGASVTSHLVTAAIFALGFGGAAVLARFTRSAMLEILGQPYIRTASAKGVPWRRVITDHALPNAAIPTVTILGFMVGSLIAGAVVVESVFSWPGVASYALDALLSSDYAPVQGFVLLMASVFVVVNLVVDVLYGMADPRISIG